MKRTTCRRTGAVGVARSCCDAQTFFLACTSKCLGPYCFFSFNEYFKELELGTSFGRAGSGSGFYGKHDDWVDPLVPGSCSRTADR